jgi:hypothetical protein
MKDASEAFYDLYHEDIKGLGYELTKGSFILGPKAEDCHIMTAIRPPDYSEDIGKKIREIIGMEFEYDGITVGVALSPSINALYDL